MSTWAERTHTWSEWQDTWANDVLGGQLRLVDADVSASATVGATLRVRYKITSGITGTVTLTGTLTGGGVLSLSAALTASAALSGDVLVRSLPWPLEGGISASASITAPLERTVPISAELIAQGWIADVTNLGGRAGHKPYSEVLI